MKRVPGLGCPHCEHEGFFNLPDQVEHIKQEHPDKPYARGLQMDNHLVNYFPNLQHGMPHVYTYSRADNPQKMLGRMVLKDEGSVDAVEVHPKYRRQGIATHLWDTAKAIAQETPGAPEPKHSPSRTRAGEQWAKKVGGDLPKRQGSYVSQQQFRHMGWE